MCKTIELADQMFDVACKVRSEWADLQKSLSEVDQKITDIKHYIEFSSLNVVQGYRAQNLLKKTLQERREIKNNIESLQPVFMVIGNHTEARQTKLMEKIKLIKSTKKSYRVRIMKDVLGDTLPSSRKI